ncbi:MAG: homoserine kinase [Verrucomicrobiota bacterium]
MLHHPVTIQIPATTANLGPGFDALGVALNLYNRVSLNQPTDSWGDPFFREAASLFYRTTEIDPQAFEIEITGDVPRSRGLGSSVTVRLGIIAGLNEKFGKPVDDETLFRLVTELEGHPDNAAPACFGGFVAGSPLHHHRFPVKEELKFVTIIPDFVLETSDARKVLPEQIGFKDCVANIQNTALITAAFASESYETLDGAFTDTLHQPYRLDMIPGAAQALNAAVEAGALGAFISGAGPAVMALTLKHWDEIAAAMSEALIAAGQHPPQIRILEACNQGWKRVD